MSNGNGLILTLGHGSSAILILNNKIINGYQTERITGIKGDSSFPKAAVEEILKFNDIPNNIDIYISHWNPDGDETKMSKKHYDYSYIKKKFTNSKIFSCNKEITHHDAHAYSVLAYNNENIEKNSYIIVADGFGNFSEVISVYEIQKQTPVKIETIYGYQNSLGLLYQYATEYTGLRGNRDEWKLNAYSNEASYDEFLKAKECCKLFLKMKKLDLNPNLEELDKLKKYIYYFLNKFLYIRFVPTPKRYVAVFLQQVVKTVITDLIKKHNMKNVYLVGGCFLNVQLNGEILNEIEGKICINPLSGDEGAGLGLFSYYNSFKMPTDLCFGIRKLKQTTSNSTENIHYHYTSESLIQSIDYFLSKNKIINVVRGNMEFGPRAYCNTSTMCIASEENKYKINVMNSRPEIMPMCPVITDVDATRLFKNIDRVIRSHKHMVIALESDKCIAGIYYETLDKKFTYRPQVIDNKHHMYKICKKYGPLINTSFNNHGHPICYNIEDVFRTHSEMQKINNEIITLVEVNYV
jgi:carbamoyltransferase